MHLSLAGIRPGGLLPRTKQVLHHRRQQAMGILRRALLGIGVPAASLRSPFPDPILLAPDFEFVRQFLARAPPAPPPSPQRAPDSGTRPPAAPRRAISQFRTAAQRSISFRRAPPDSLHRPGSNHSSNTFNSSLNRRIDTRRSWMASASSGLRASMANLAIQLLQPRRSLGLGPAFSSLDPHRQRKTVRFAKHTRHLLRLPLFDIHVAIGKQAQLDRHSPARPPPPAPPAAPGSGPAPPPAAAAASEERRCSDPPDPAPEMFHARPAASTCGGTGTESRSPSAPDPRTPADPSSPPNTWNADDGAIHLQSARCCTDTPPLPAAAPWPAANGAKAAAPGTASPPDPPPSERAVPIRRSGAPAPAPPCAHRRSGEPAPCPPGDAKDPR